MRRVSSSPCAIPATPAPSPVAALEALVERVRADAGYWSRKRLVIWCFAARAFGAPDDWRPVSIAP